jgi:hypothetical protein
LKAAVRNVPAFGAAPTIWNGYVRLDFDRITS